jgi:serine protease DegS
VPYNRTLSKIIDFISLPVLTGLAVATVLLLLFPEFRSAPQTGNNSDNIDERGLATNWYGPVSYAQAVKKAAPSVVNIYTRTKTKPNNHPLLQHPFLRRLYNQQQERIRDSLGSGVIMDKAGLIVTSYHVVANVDQILVLLYDGQELPAQVVGTDPETDLAVLKIASDNLQAIPVGNPDQAEIGDVVLAIGNPFGMGQTVTQGIVSATQRYGLNLNTFESYIQTDANINPGNSGGALVDGYGNLLGINSAKINHENSEGIAFAVPANEVQKVVDHIIEHGRVIRGWLGFEAYELTPMIAQQLKINPTSGLFIAKIIQGGPAHMAEIRPGDIVTAINGMSVTDRHRSVSQIADIVPGEPIELEIQRNNRRLNITAIAGERPTAN